MEWRALPYFQNPARLAAVKGADEIGERDQETGKVVRIQRQVYEKVVGDRLISNIHPMVTVSISRKRGELLLIRDACGELKGRCDCNERDKEGLLS
jgi:hypothetical protein